MLVKEVIKLPDKEIKDYYDSLVEQLRKQGATEEDINLISDEMIENAIKNNRKPEDLAWAILQ